MDSLGYRSCGGWSAICAAVIESHLHPEIRHTEMAATYRAHWQGVVRRSTVLMENIEKFRGRHHRDPVHFSELYPAVKQEDYSGLMLQYEKIFTEWQRQTAEDRMKRVKALLGVKYLAWEALVSARIGGLTLTPEEAGGRLDYNRRGAYPRARKIEHVNTVMSAIELHISKNGCRPCAFQDIESLLPKGYVFKRGEGYIIFQTWIGLTRGVTIEQ